MILTTFLVFQILLLCSTSNVVTAQSSFTFQTCVDSYGNYTASSTFKRNLDKLFSTMKSNTQINYGFYNFSVGGHNLEDTVYGIAIFRPDWSGYDCHRCLNDGTAEISQTCPNQKEAIGWYYNRCMIRYSNRDILGKMEISPWHYLNSTALSMDQKGFNQTVSTLLAKLRKEAASGGSPYKYATGEANVTGSGTTIYAFVQCTPDLEELDCYDCLDNATHFSLFNPSGQVANAVFYTSCNVRYESSLFYNDTNLISMKRGLPPSFPTSTKDDENDTIQSLQFKFGVIKLATGDFSQDNKLGQGGFGIVYKGRLPDGQEVAVKRLLKKSRHADAQFKNEILTLAKLDHRNLVRLLGYCLEEEEFLLVYELMANGSLDRYIFDSVHRISMQWDTRYRIINGIARGLVYLHQDSRLRIIHRDLKAGNVLLDANFDPKIADFGMARLFDIEHTQSLASKIVGTYGYMAPEYALRGYVSMKSDVYSFGVLLLEIISGQRISAFRNEENSEGLLTYAWKNWQEGTPWKFVDPALSPDGFSTEILQCTHIGLLCVQHNPTYRPTMSTVVLMLSSNSHSLLVPSPPGFYSRGQAIYKQIFPVQGILQANPSTHQQNIRQMRSP